MNWFYTMRPWILFMTGIMVMLWNPICLLLDPDMILDWSLEIFGLVPVAAAALDFSTRRD
jgi:hypothetical protein